MPLHKEIQYGVVCLPHPKKKPSQITEQYQEETIFNILCRERRKLRYLPWTYDIECTK